MVKLLGWLDIYDLRSLVLKDDLGDWFIILVKY